MAGGKLTVEIGADITDFENKIKEVELDIKELSKVKLDRLKVGLDTTEINSQIKDAKASLNSLKTTVKDTGAQIGGQFTRQVGNGSNTLTQFSRIAQDAPYGIIGIGNNITATAESFSYLKQQTGSTGGALKALASSIAGTGGILLGVSLLTTGLTLMAQSGLTVGDVIDKITGNFDEFGAALKKANDEAVKNSAAEISGMNALVSSAQNVNLSMKDRLIAVQELQKTYPGYFGNLSKEQILNGDVANAVKGVTDALIAKAKAQAYTGELVKLSQEEFKLEEKKLQLLSEKAKLEQSSASKNAAALAATGKNQDFVINAAIRNTKAIKDLDNQLSENAIELEKNAQAQAKWTSRINENVAASIRLKQEVEKPIKTFNTPQVTGIGNNIIPAPLFDVNGIAVFNGQVDAFGNKIKELPGVIKTSLGQVPVIINEALIQYTVIMAEFTNQLNELIQNSVPNAISNLGSALGEALATGTDVVSALGTSLLQSLGSFISQLGSMLIQYGLLLVGFGKAQLAFQAGDPVTKIGAGIAMIALGIAASAAGSAIGSFASGNGRGGGASSASGSGANNQSFSSSGFSSGGGGGTVVFEIAGQKLIGVLNNTLNSNKRLGGTLGLG
jgi:hypothetical protein